MAASAVFVTVTYQAKNGLYFQVKFHVATTVISPTDPIITGIIAKINALTASLPVRIEISFQAAPSSSFIVDASYVSEDKGFARFIDTAGNAHNYKVPAPVASVLADDTQAIPNTGIWAVYTAAVLDHALSQGGTAMGEYITSYRKENRKPNKR